MLILGINAFHGDASAAIVRDGVLVAAAEEERFRRVKHWAGFPAEAIRYCLTEARATIGGIEHITVNQNSNAHLIRKLLYLISSRPTIGLVMDRIRARQRRENIAELLAKEFPGQAFRGTVHNIEHHASHLSSAFHVSPFRQAAVVSVDGFGDFSSAAWGVGSGADIRVFGRVYFPHSLGIFYQAITQYLGFPHYGDEYKVMGLAPYGKPSRMGEMRQIVQLGNDGSFALALKFFRHHRRRIPFEWMDGSPHFDDLFTPILEELLGPRRNPTAPLEDRHHDVARSAQAMYEEAFFHLLKVLQARTGLTDLTLAGGCAMNSVANGKVRRLTQFRRLYVQSAAGDAGGAIGSAFALWHRLGGQRCFVMDHAYWGPAARPHEVAALLRNRSAELNRAGCSVEEIGEESLLCERTAEAIADGRVIGWFQGRMEWGPRALGNRSIICDPRRHDMKQILNAKIKRRELFRPFAPSVLDRAVAQWFEEDDNVPFMMQVFQIREDKRATVPAVTHVDGSGRLQTVYRATNPRYYALIEHFERLTGVPMVLNTSFNENEPVVCRPEEALDCFLRTEMDALVIENVLITRRS